MDISLVGMACEARWGLKHRNENVDYSEVLEWPVKPVGV